MGNVIDLTERIRAGETLEDLKILIRHARDSNEEYIVIDPNVDLSRDELNEITTLIQEVFLIIFKKAVKVKYGIPPNALCVYKTSGVEWKKFENCVIRTFAWGLFRHHRYHEHDRIEVNGAQYATLSAVSRSDYISM